jgi:predicted ATPase
VIAHNLPTHAIPFIGRAEELSQIVALFHDPTCRLLTLTGPGGIGKTRLAVEVARLMTGDNEVGAHDCLSMESSSLSDGSCFVPLQPLTSPDFIVPPPRAHFHCGGELIQAAWLPEGKNTRARATTRAYSRGLHCRQREMRRRLALVTRERLRLREEWLFDVGGLTFPANAHVNGWDNFTAVQLFLQSARRAGYAPVDVDTAAIVRICQVVEGIPLAVELAAAWVRIMPCAEIAREVEHSLDILTTTTRNMPEKHRRCGPPSSAADPRPRRTGVFRNCRYFAGVHARGA